MGVIVEPSRRKNSWLIPLRELESIILAVCPPSPPPGWDGYCNYHLQRLITYPSSSSFLIGPEVESVHPVTNSVALHPLVSVVSSLSRAFDDGCAVTKVNLEPLTSVVITRNPRAEPCTAAHGI